MTTTNTTSTSPDALPRVTMSRQDERVGTVRCQVRLAAPAQQVWRACTTPDGLVRWIGRVAGDFHQGGTVDAVMVSGWNAAVRIDACRPEEWLAMTNAPGTPGQSTTELWLGAEAGATTLTLEDRDIPLDEVAFFAAGWHAHLEDLAACLADPPTTLDERYSAGVAGSRWNQRFRELTARYRDEPLG